MLALDAKIKLYFASPKFTREKYQHLEKELTGQLDNPVRYSPLHIRRQEIYYIMGINAHTNEDFAAKLGFGPLNTVGISLMVSQCLILGTRLFKNDLEVFTNFMKTEELLAQALKTLRNADQHGLTPLRYSGRAGESRRLFFLDDRIEMPIMFGPKSEDREDYFVNPMLLHKAFEVALEAMEEYFLDPECVLRGHFDETITRNNWYRFVSSEDTPEIAAHPSEPAPGSN